MSPFVQVLVFIALPATAFLVGFFLGARRDPLPRQVRHLRSRTRRPRRRAYGPGDPRINCGGDCLACMWSVEEDAGETRARRPDEFETGMDDDRVWQPGGEDPRPFFALSAAEVKLLTGDLSDFDGGRPARHGGGVGARPATARLARRRPCSPPMSEDRKRQHRNMAVQAVDRIRAKRKKGDDDPADDAAQAVTGAALLLSEEIADLRRAIEGDRPTGVYSVEIELRRGGQTVWSDTIPVRADSPHKAAAAARDEVRARGLIEEGVEVGARVLPA